jgi:hypothetical protein
VTPIPVTKWQRMLLNFFLRHVEEYRFLLLLKLFLEAPVNQEWKNWGSKSHLFLKPSVSNTIKNTYRLQGPGCVTIAFLNRTVSSWHRALFGFSARPWRPARRPLRPSYTVPTLQEEGFDVCLATSSKTPFKYKQHKITTVYSIQLYNAMKPNFRRKKPYNSTAPSTCPK